ncbi:deoxyribodipyrimidine photo-lyase [Alphaproteobacteria bacterium LSUCC0684]
MATVLCWFHQDLRIGDHPALTAAISSGHAVVPVYILDESAAGDWAMGGASRWWLHHSLDDLARGFERMGSKLILRKGDAVRILPALAEEIGAVALYTHKRGEPWSKAQLSAVAEVLAKEGIPTHLENGSFLKDFGEVRSKAGTRMKVFTPYKRNLLAQGGMRAVLPRPGALPSPSSWPRSATLDEMKLLPRNPDWSGGIDRAWRVGEAAALQRLDDFLEDTITRYGTSRDRPSISGTSRLSPHLHFGEISPVTVFHAVMEHAGGAPSADAETFIAEVIWREFSYELLDQFADMPDRPLRAEFEHFPWRQDYASDLAAWQRGQTGYPLIDAGMRELYETGWMHNRVRMITASFLTKHLLIPWQEGARWFHDTLVDADLASNSAGWQWVAGCGADASPYFRVFNPITQGQKFDAGAYVRKWVPEVAKMDDRSLFAPFDAPEGLRLSAGLRLGKTYPEPLVDHAAGRQRALNAFAQIKSQDN